MAAFWIRIEGDPDPMSRIWFSVSAIRTRAVLFSYNHAMSGGVNIAAQTASTPRQRSTTFTSHCDSYPAIVTSLCRHGFLAKASVTGCVQTYNARMGSELSGLDNFVRGYMMVGSWREAGGWQQT